MQMQTILHSLSAVLTLAVLPAATLAQPIREYSPVTDERLRNPEPENWLMFRRTYDGWGYSPLRQIDTRNVDELVPVWTVSTGITEGHQSSTTVSCS